jgi:hypothetical protein
MFHRAIKLGNKTKQDTVLTGRVGAISSPPHQTGRAVLPVCFYHIAQHSGSAVPAMRMNRRITPIVLGFSDAPAYHKRIIAKSYPVPAAFAVIRKAQLHGSCVFEAH